MKRRIPLFSSNSALLSITISGTGEVVKFVAMENTENCCNLMSALVVGIDENYAVQ